MKRKHTTQLTIPFKRCVVLHNPASTRSAAVQYRIEELRALFPDKHCTVLQTSPKGVQATTDLLFKHQAELGDGTLLVLLAGDGTVNGVADAIMHDPRSTAATRRTVLLPLWGGNANDLAHMLNGSSHRLSLVRLLASGKIVAIHPMLCQFTPLPTTEKPTATQRTAICYASFGASAFAAQRLESLRGKRRFWHAFEATKFTHEFGMVIRAMINAPRFRVEYDHHRIRNIYEQIFMNGSRFAKVTGVPLKLTDEAFCQTVVERKRLSAVTFHIMELVGKRSIKKTLSKKPMTFTVRDDVWAQVDGEVLRLPAGTRIRIKRSPEPFRALSTLL